SALIRAEGRGIALTNAGRMLHAEVSQAFDIIARATTQVRPAARPTLNIWCIPGLANRRLLLRLPELTGPPRNWDINLQPTLSHPDLERGEDRKSTRLNSNLNLVCRLLLEKKKNNCLNQTINNNK